MQQIREDGFGEGKLFASAVLKQHNSFFMLICVANIFLDYKNTLQGAIAYPTFGNGSDLQNCILTEVFLFVPSRVRKSAFGWNFPAGYEAQLK